MEGTEALRDGPDESSPESVTEEVSDIEAVLLTDAWQFLWRLEVYPVRT
jgi:hypothetical protein